MVTVTAYLEELRNIVNKLSNGLHEELYIDIIMKELLTDMLTSEHAGPNFTRKCIYSNYIKCV